MSLWLFSMIKIKKDIIKPNMQILDEILREERKWKCQELVNTLKKQHSIFIKQSIIQDAATAASFMVSTYKKKSVIFRW